MAITVTPDMIMSVRYEIGDNSVELPILSDAEYSYYLNKHEGSIRRASLDCAKTILFKLSMTSGKRDIDILVIDNRMAANAYKEALITYIKNPDLSGALDNIKSYAGGISNSDIEKNKATIDTNYVKNPVEPSLLPYSNLPTLLSL